MQPPIADDYAGIARRMTEIAHAERPMPDNATIIVKPPSKCNIDEIDIFCSLVGLGGEVQTDGLRARVRNAQTLVFLQINGETVGTVAIKRPNESYRADVFALAGYPDPDNYPFELGWLMILPEHRDQGYAEKLLRAALATVQDKVFATAAADNKTVRRVNRNVGLLPVGQPFQAASGRMVALYV